MKRSLLLILALYIAGNLKSQTLFNKAFPADTANSIFTAVVKSNSSTEAYIISEFYTKTGIINDVRIKETDATGKILWEKQYDIGGEDRVYSVIELAGGNIVACGRTSNNSTGKQDAFIIKFDGSGNKLWLKTYTNAGYKTALFTIKKSPGGGFIACGDNVSDTSAVIRKAYILKTDDNGNTEWEKHIEDYDQSYLNDVEITDKNIFVFAGTSYIINQDYKLLFVKLDGSGKVLVKRSYNDYSDAGGIELTPDKGFMIAALPLRNLPTTGIIVKTDSEGTVQWNKTYSDPNKLNAYFQDIKHLADGNYVLTGAIDSVNSVKHQYCAWVYKIKPNGDSIWNKAYTFFKNPYSSNEVLDISPTENNGFIICGATLPSYAVSSYYQGWLVKMDSVGCADAACTQVTGIENYKDLQPGKTAVYPNPSNGNVYLYSTVKVSVTEIYDVTGRLVKNVFADTDEALIVNAGELKPGIYFYRVIYTTKQSTYSGKLVITE